MVEISELSSTAVLNQGIATKQPAAGADATAAATPIRLLGQFGHRVVYFHRSEGMNGNSAHRPKGTEGRERLSACRGSRIKCFGSRQAHLSQESLESRL
jgi:hypothetical protein